MANINMNRFLKMRFKALLLWSEIPFLFLPSIYISQTTYFNNLSLHQNLGYQCQLLSLQREPPGVPVLGGTVDTPYIFVEVIGYPLGRILP